MKIRGKENAARLVSPMDRPVPWWAGRLGLVLLSLYGGGCSSGSGTPEPGNETIENLNSNDSPPSRPGGNDVDNLNDNAPSPPDAFTYEIDESLKLPERRLPEFENVASRDVGMIVGPEGVPEEFVVNEVILHPSSLAELASFLERYNGTVLHDGTLPTAPDIPADGVPDSTGVYLIQVDLTRSTLDDLAANLTRAGMAGEFRFSSDKSARLVALLGRELDLGVNANLLAYTDSSSEHAADGGGNLDAETWAWMTEDDDPRAAGEQGLSVGVARAWKYLRYMDFPPTPPSGEPTTWSPPVVAVLDGGFWLDEDTGVPLMGNVDYYNSFDAPWQVNAAPPYGSHAGGANPMPCEGGRTCDWHGQGAFGVCCAKSGNGFGGAGSGGPVVRPLIIKVDGSAFSSYMALRTAAFYGADIVTMSYGFPCLHLCNLGGPLQMRDLFQWGVGEVVTAGGTVLAAAGNLDTIQNFFNQGFEPADLDSFEHDQIPCELDYVICVGAVNDPPTGSGPSGTTNKYNFGSSVDIWAPTGIYSTITEDSVAKDSNNTGTDELYKFGGTSAATPFVAGIVALMLTLDPSLTWSEVQQILQDTANRSDDPLVTHGYVDAFRAVAAVKPNESPIIEITSPEEGATVSYAFGLATLRARVADPDPGAILEDLQVYFSSQGALPNPCFGQLRFHDNAPYFECSGGFANLGPATIVAQVIDPFGAEAFTTVNVSVINSAPSITIVEPTDGATFYNHQPIHFGAYTFDPDQHPFPESGVSWQSSIQGPLGTGWSVTTMLNPGEHLITARAMDEFDETTEGSILVLILQGDGVPTATIDEPADGSSFLPGTNITFRATASDPEDGPLGGSSLSWSSDIDGFLGTGGTIRATLSAPEDPCNPEYVTHIITLTVVDSDGHRIAYHIQVNIGIIC